MNNNNNTIVDLPDQATARIPQPNFISKENGLMSWLADRRPQADCNSLPDFDYVFLLHRRGLAGLSAWSC